MRCEEKWKSCNTKQRSRNELLTSTARASNFDTLLLLKPGEFAYACEMFNQTPELNVPGLSGQPQVYARTIF